MNVITLRDWPTVRQWIQVVAAAILGSLVTYGYIETNVAAAVVAFIAASLPNALSVFNSASGFRTFVYTIVGAVQTFLVAVDVFTDAQIAPITNIVFAVIGVSVAVTHTPTPLAPVIPLRQPPAGGSTKAA